MNIILSFFLFNERIHDIFPHYKNRGFLTNFRPRIIDTQIKPSLIELANNYEKSAGLVRHLHSSRHHGV